MEIDKDKIDDAVLALLWLTLHDGDRAWKGFDWDTLDRLHAKGLIVMGLDSSDGRVKIAGLTPKGRALHDQIRNMALARECALLSVLSQSDRDTLLHLLKRLHENLPAVEEATARYVANRYPRALTRGMSTGTP